jgi:hypothetical protein
MSSYANAQNRLWVQVMPPHAQLPPGAEAAAIPAVFVGEMIASGVGAIIKSAADRLIASDQYVMKTVLAYEPSFVIRANAASASFLLNCITLNVGRKALPIYDDKARAPLSIDVIRNSSEYGESPVVIGLELKESTDGTALTARVTHWKYTQFLDAPATWFRKRRRKITIEVKISDVEGSVLWATAMQVEADSSMLPNTRPNDGERLPWRKRPVRNFSGERAIAKDQDFGPVNIEASITEVAEPSGFAKLIGTILGYQKAAIEGYVKDRVSQIFDETEAAKAKLALLEDTSTARAEYESAYDAAAKARKTFDIAADQAAKTAARQTLELKLATLRQKEILARSAFDRAGLTFEPMPAIERPI